VTGETLGSTVTSSDQAPEDAVRLSHHHVPHSFIITGTETASLSLVYSAEGLISMHVDHESANTGRDRAPPLSSHMSTAPGASPM